MKNIVCKNFDEIIKAHDILDSCLRGDIPELPIEEMVRRAMMYQRDVLCWLLGHGGGIYFQENLEMLTKKVRSLGYELYDSQTKTTH